jgi:hypothetical protein
MTTKADTITYHIERNRRYESYKGLYNCEVKVNGSYFVDAQGDTATQARRNAEIKVRAAIAAGRVNV